MRTPLADIYGRYNLTIYTKPYQCGGKCSYCFTDNGIPNGYFYNEDTQLAASAGWESSCQLEFLFNKHSIKRGYGSKFEIIVLGGSFTYYDEQYLLSYVKGVYDFLNGFVSVSFDDAKEYQKIANDRCVVLAVETRPDLINDNWLKFLLYLGVTKIEIGVQHTNNKVIEFNRRGYDVSAVSFAAKLIRNYGFKLGVHLMIGLPGSSNDIDLDMLINRIWQEDLFPDYLKIYPAVIIDNVTHNDQNYATSKNWIPIEKSSYIEILKAAKPLFPSTVYINRIQRVTDAEINIHGINDVIDRKQFSDNCSCLFHRRVKYVLAPRNNESIKWNINRISIGPNHFFEALSESGAVLGYARLLCTDQNIGYIREIRVFGKMMPIGIHSDGEICHSGIGKALMTIAESYAKSCGLNFIYVIAGIGVKEYFEKIGYIDSGTYMIKQLQILQN